MSPRGYEDRFNQVDLVNPRHDQQPPAEEYAVIDGQPMTRSEYEDWCGCHDKGADETLDAIPDLSLEAACRKTS